MKLAFSFDIFDTLLTRKVASPCSLFLILGDRAAKAGLLSISTSDFLKYRVNAESEARLSAHGQEVTFDEIYRLLVSKLGVSQSTGDALMKLELTIESEFLVPVPSALKLVDEARKISNRILFVSDMYLPASYLRAELNKYRFFRDGDRLYISNEWRSSKINGALFRKVIATEKMRPETIYHTGDRKDADFDVPSKLGIKAQHLNVCRLTRYEQILDEFAVASSGFSSLIAGISRITRLIDLQPNAHLAKLSQIAASLISPTIVFYSIWILREAKRRNIKRLYFVSRDGCLVKKITDALICSLNLPIETRYLYGSRQAWHLPAITNFSPASVSWLFEKTRTLSLRIILKRIQMSPEQIGQILNDLGWPKECWDTQLNDTKLAQLQEKLLGCAKFRSCLEKHVIQKRKMALGYLEQEGLFDSNSWALIDLGWHGRLQHSLQKLLGLKQTIRTFGLYFGLYADSAVLPELETASYLDCDLRNPPDESEIPSLVFLMESFCTAPHGSTIGYEVLGDKIIPIFRAQGVESLAEWGISMVHRVVGRFAVELGRLSLPETIMKWNSRPAVCKLLKTFSMDPLPEEVRSWGSFPYEDEQAGGGGGRLTRKHELTLENIRIALTFGDDRFLPLSWDVLWRGGQLHISSINNTIIRCALKLGAAKRKLGKVMRRALK